jgi:predicted SAM-dependent methyltransferase
MLEKINVGCGTNPTPGWLNLDNSPSVLIAQAPALMKVLGATGLLGDFRLTFAKAAQAGGIRWANATRLPVADASAEVVYSSHMVEHLDPADMRLFLGEVRRVLVSGGILRLGVPDLAFLVRQYLSDHDADKFVAATLLAREPSRSLRDRLVAIVMGHRGHAWMYDGPSLIHLLEAEGFRDVVEVPAGETTIPAPGALDLHERVGETVYVEARKA